MLEKLLLAALGFLRRNDPKQTVASTLAEKRANVRIKMLEAQLKSLEAKEQELVIADVTLQIAGRQKRFALEQDNYKARGEALKQLDARSADHQEKGCNHRKGGNALTGIIKGQGDSEQYAVIKHRYRNGDIHVKCLRCAKTWKPGDPDYFKALEFKTNNAMSSDAVVATEMDGRLTGDFAEVWRKWSNAGAFKGTSFRKYQMEEEGAKAAAMVKKLQEEHSKKSSEPITKPVTFKRELVPTFTITEKPAPNNENFNVVQNMEPNVS